MHYDRLYKVAEIIRIKFFTIGDKTFFYFKLYHQH